MTDIIRTIGERLESGAVMAESSEVAIVIEHTQTDEDIAELIARFRTPPGCDWTPLQDDILTVLKIRRKEIERLQERVDDLACGYVGD